MTRRPALAGGKLLAGEVVIIISAAYLDMLWRNQSLMATSKAQKCGRCRVGGLLPVLDGTRGLSHRPSFKIGGAGFYARQRYVREMPYAAAPAETSHREALWRAAKSKHGACSSCPCGSSTSAVRRLCRLSAYGANMSSASKLFRASKKGGESIENQ